MRLTEDLKILKPTILAIVPRLLNLFYDQIKANIDEVKVIR